MNDNHIECRAALFAVVAELNALREGVARLRGELINARAAFIGASVILKSQILQDQADKITAALQPTSTPEE